MTEITCCLCSKILSSVAQLEFHLALVHYNSNPYQCEVCLNRGQLSSFPTEASIRDHVVKEHADASQQFYYRVWFSAEIDRQRDEIRKLIDKSVETSMTRTQSPSETKIFPIGQFMQHVEKYKWSLQKIDEYKRVHLNPNHDFIETIFKVGYSFDKRSNLKKETLDRFSNFALDTFSSNPTQYTVQVKFSIVYEILMSDRENTAKSSYAELLESVNKTDNDQLACAQKVRDKLCEVLPEPNYDWKMSIFYTYCENIRGMLQEDETVAGVKKRKKRKDTEEEKKTKDTWTLDETYSFLKTGKLHIAGPSRTIEKEKTEKNQKNVGNLAKAYAYLLSEDIICNHDMDLNIAFLQELNKKVRWDEPDAGSIKPCRVEQLKEVLSLLNHWMCRRKDRIHPICLATLAHYAIGHIHPFRDGNGRTSRMVQNYILMRSGYPPISIREEVKYSELFISLEQTIPVSCDYNRYVKGSKPFNLYVCGSRDLRPMIRFLTNCLIETMEKMYDPTMSEIIARLNSPKIEESSDFGQSVGSSDKVESTRANSKGSDRSETHSQTDFPQLVDDEIFDSEMKSLTFADPNVEDSNVEDSPLSDLSLTSGSSSPATPTPATNKDAEVTMFSLFREALAGINPSLLDYDREHTAKVREEQKAERRRLKDGEFCWLNLLRSALEEINPALLECDGEKDVCKTDSVVASDSVENPIKDEE